LAFIVAVHFHYEISGYESASGALVRTAAPVVIGFALPTG